MGSRFRAVSGRPFSEAGYEGLLFEFKRIFPTCPICGSDLGYEATHRFVTYYVRCKSCEAVWQPSFNSRQKVDRLLLLEPDKDMRASSFVRKGDSWHRKGYKVEFWKSLALGGLKRGEEPTAPSHPPLTDLEEEVLDYIIKHGEEISIPQASEELGLSEARLKATIDKLKEKNYLEYLGKPE